MNKETDKSSKMKKTEKIELQELNEVEMLEEQIKARKKWIEDAEKSGRVWLICIESFVVISILLLVVLGAVSYQYNWLSPCIELISESEDMTCKTGNFAFGFSDRLTPGNIESRLLF